MGCPNTSLSCSWGQRAPPQRHPHCQAAHRYTRPTLNACLRRPHPCPRPATIRHPLVAPSHNPCRHPCGCDFMRRPTYQGATQSPWPTPMALAQGHGRIHLTAQSNPRMNPRDCVTGPPLETPVPWEYPTGVWALLPWTRQPMTPHFCMQSPGAGGRSHTSSAELRMRRRYRALSGRHDLPRGDGRHITAAVAAHTGV